MASPSPASSRFPLEIGAPTRRALPSFCVPSFGARRPALWWRWLAFDSTDFPQKKTNNRPPPLPNREITNPFGNTSSDRVASLATLRKTKEIRLETNESKKEERPRPDETKRKRKRKFQSSAPIKSQRNWTQVDEQTARRRSNEKKPVKQDQRSACNTNNNNSITCGT